MNDETHRVDDTGQSLATLRRELRDIVREEIALATAGVGGVDASNKGDTTDNSATMDADQVAEYLGIGRKSVYAAAKSGELPSRRIGRRVLFSRRAVVAWFETQDGDMQERND